MKVNDEFDAETQWTKWTWDDKESKTQSKGVTQSIWEDNRND